MSSTSAPKSSLASDTTPNQGGNDTKPKMFDKEGAIGHQFTEKGMMGGTAQMMGGPFDKEGMIGKQFTAEGSIGGTAQNMMGGQKPA
ncbi:uncharacterized protein TRIREDRAFT_107853 [Trichoderma reesei QM6a]|uniref:Predicted protein n=2 Tax=Hypocrea jecorina TaxID=51453 RepID=G0RKJ2_HYPJQ|nr:uncharacterized protein TRIREDRAFT_107853 [Trichoderma reesei QM6a]EGR48258.1 predicted protein [Trichoderma reesei QM6a]ETS07088.1 hypothetical protein M419DRAFT_69953 [Trichoderma reesei RUT C-30]